MSVVSLAIQVSGVNKLTDRHTDRQTYRQTDRNDDDQQTRYYIN